LEIEEAEGEVDECTTNGEWEFGGWGKLWELDE